MTTTRPRTGGRPLFVLVLSAHAPLPRDARLEVAVPARCFLAGVTDGTRPGTRNREEMP